jgi:tRNA(Ile)-lysidine synthase
LDTVFALEKIGRRELKSIAMKAQIFEKFIRTIKRHRLLEPGDRVVVAVSGGGDSVALLHLLLDIRTLYALQLTVAHLNHCLRGSASEADEEFVRELAHNSGVSCFIESIPAVQSSSPKGNLESWARECRYEFLSRCAAKLSAQKIALGHTMSDQAETFLMRLIRGSGSLGLASIPCKRGPFIRPLIDLQRYEIRQYLRNRGLRWREDETNRNTHFVRNRLRLELIPQLQDRYNRNITELLSRSAEILREESDALQFLATGLFQREACLAEQRVRWNIQGLLSYPLGLRSLLIRESVRYLSREAPSFNQTSAIMELLQEGKSGKVLKACGVRVTRQFDQLIFEDKVCERPEYSYALEVPGSVELSQIGSVFVARFDASESDSPSVNRWEFYLNDEELRSGLIIRNWKPGDVYFMEGANSPKSVAELLSRKRVPRFSRISWPVITVAGRILCVKDFPFAGDRLLRGHANKGNKVVVEERKSDNENDAGEVVVQ